jgi:hypothetical protein
MSLRWSSVTASRLYKLDLNDSCRQLSNVRKATQMSDQDCKELERRLEQSRRLFKGANDPTTTKRLAQLISELEQEGAREDKK